MTSPIKEVRRSIRERSVLFQPPWRPANVESRKWGRAFAPLAMVLWCQERRRYLSRFGPNRWRTSRRGTTCQTSVWRRCAGSL